MNKQKVSILALVIAFALCMAAMCATLMGSMNANAEASISKSSVFYSEGAELVDGESGDYLSYKISDADTGSLVKYNKNLALKWYAFTDEATVGDAGAVQYFSMTFALQNTDFESFKIAMETTQMSMSKDGKTVNEIVFTVDGSNLKASVNGAEAVTVGAADGDITLSLSEEAGLEGLGDFAVSVKSGDASAVKAGTFKNIGMNYAKYASSSADTPIAPLTFTAETAAEGSVTFSIKSLNGQSFRLNDNKEITDDTAPVLVIDSEIKQFRLGEKVEFDYIAIDVCSTVKTPERFYLVDGMPVTEETDGAEETVEAAFDDAGELVGYRELDTSKYFFEDDFAEGAFTETGYGTLSIAYKLEDNNSNSAYYFIEWYAQKDTATGHIKMVDPRDASLTNARPEMAFYTEDGTENTEKVKEYQAKVTEASMKDGKSIQVGSGAYYYIPSLKPYITDATCGYTDMTFTVYYWTGSSSVQTVTGDYDELRIPVNTEGDYAFCVVPTNKSGNAMVGLKENGGKTEISSSNVMELKNVAVFTFRVEYNGAYIEEPETDEIGYVDVTYTIDDFEIIALSGYKTEYALYRFVAKQGVSITSLDQLKKAEENGTIADLGEWIEIKKYDSSLGEDEEDNMYEWNPTSTLSFVPQEKGFYKVTVTVDDQQGKTETLPTAFKIINVTAEADVIPGATYWLQNNILSVVFLGIGVLCLIAIVILLVVKPKDKAVLEAEKARKEELKEKRENRK